MCPPGAGSRSCSSTAIFSDILSAPFPTFSCLLALPGCPTRKQIRAAREAALRAARLRASPSHRVQGVLQRVQGCTPETGAPRTLDQWFVFLYIHTDSFSLFDISFYIDVECTPHGPLLLASVPHLAHGRMCPLQGCKPFISSFLLVSSFIGLGLRHTRTMD